MTRPARILLAVDDVAASAAAGGALAVAGHEVRVWSREPELPQVVFAFRPDLVIMDLLVADHSLLELAVRRVHASMRPLLLCAIEGGSVQRIPALEAGADACIDRPYSTNDLEVHVRALLRRSTWLARGIHRIGELIVDEDAHVVVFADQAFTLSAKEFGLLAMLAQHAGSVLSKRRLLEALWGYDAYDENLVEVHMSILRRGLPPGARSLIHTVRGAGYVLREDLSQGLPA